jgi:hypothetical protein
MEEGGGRESASQCIEPAACAHESVGPCAHEIVGPRKLTTMGPCRVPSGGTGGKMWWFSGCRPPGTFQSSCTWMRADDAFTPAHSTVSPCCTACLPAKPRHVPHPTPTHPRPPLIPLTRTPRTLPLYPHPHPLSRPPHSHAQKETPACCPPPPPPQQP